MKHILLSIIILSIIISPVFAESSISESSDTFDNTVGLLKIETYHDYEYFPFQVPDKRRFIYIGDESFVHGFIPISTIEDIEETGNELYSLLMDAHFETMEERRYLKVIHSKSDNMIAFLYRFDGNGIGNSIEVLINGNTCEVVGCWQTE